MENDLSSLPDDLLDVRQDLSQYSYDPADMLESLDNQQLSQSSEKLGGFLPFANAGFASDEQVDLFYDFDFDNTYTTSAEHHAVVVAPEGCGNNVMPEIESVETSSEVLPRVVGNLESDSVPNNPSALAVPSFLALDFYGNDITFDVKSELSSDVPTPSTTVDTYSPDSTSSVIFLYEDAGSELSITDEQLLKLSTRDLNRQIRNLPADEQQRLKNRRRTLKNRGYAQTCRTRRVGLRSELQADNERLSAQIERLSADKTSLAFECDRLRKESAGLSAEQLHGEIEKLRARVDFLINERDMLCHEGARFRGERDTYKEQLNLLVTFLVSNGILVDDATGTAL